MIPGADTKKLAAEGGIWGNSVGQLVRNHKFAVSTGLDLIQAHYADQPYRTLDWVNVASSALSEAVSQNASNYVDRNNLKLDWKRVATDALIGGAGAFILGITYW